MDGSHGEITWKISSGVQRHRRYKYDRIHEFGQNCKYSEGESCHVCTHCSGLSSTEKRQKQSANNGEGNLINYPDELATRTADITASKCMCNSAISTRGARYIFSNANNFYLATALKDPEYMHIAANVVPQEFIEM